MEITSRRWPDEDTGPFVLTMEWVRRHGRPHLHSVKIAGVDASDESVPAVSTTVMRDLKLKELALEAQEQLQRLPQVKPPVEVQVEGMRPATVKRLRRAAAIYADAFRAGEAPTKAVAVRMNVSHSAAMNLVRRAREVGLLPPTSAGVPQG